MCTPDKNFSQFEFSTYTNYGQDFFFSATMENNDIDTLIKDIRDYCFYFDPDYEASLWIGEDGHGKRGAPYHIADIDKDMEETIEKVEQLCDKLVDLQNKYK